MKKKVCHFTSVHEALDDRIFVKECKALSEAGYDVCIVAKGADNNISNIKIYGCGNIEKNRIKRFFVFSKKVYKKALELDCDIYHFHDPDLLKYGLLLKKKGKKVVFDSHEDVPAQILSKKWIPKILRGLVSKLYKKYETRCVKEFDAVVTATPYIRDQFINRTNRVVDINNFPSLEDIEFHDNSFLEREATVCYAGGISRIRGENVMIDSSKNINGKLIIAGKHKKEKFDNVEYVGELNRNQVNDLYSKSICGLCLLLPEPNYINSQPIKMFEYMAAGLPFVCSDFPKWKSIVEENEVGFCVPTNNIGKIANTVNWLFENRELAQKMGKRGRELVEKTYNWENEKNKLLNLYNSIYKAI